MRSLWIALCVLLGLVALWALGPREDPNYGYRVERTSVLAKTGGLGGEGNGDPPGFGVLGDSNSDEYRANDDRGSEPWKETTLNFVELLARHRDLDFGPWGTRAEPRRAGYEYNWARSGATASSMIADGQHTGLAAQIRSGEVSYAFLWIGSNDFGPGRSTPYSYDAIYSGEVEGEQLQALLDGFVSLVEAAVDTLMAAGPERLVVADMIDYGLYPPVAERFPDPVGRQRFSDAMDYVNGRLLSTLENYENADLATHDEFATVVAEAYLDGFLEVGGVDIDMTNLGDAPTHFLLNDTHLGTVANALVANLLFLPTLNADGDLYVEPFSDMEMVVYAGIAPPVATTSTTRETHLDLQTYPNPASKSVRLSFVLPEHAVTTLSVYDSRGRLVSTPLSRILSSGPHSTTLDVSGWRAGSYTFRLRNGDTVGSERITIVR